MNLTWQPPTALQYFATLVQDDATLPLLETVACVAQDEYPDHQVQDVLDNVDQLLHRLRRTLPVDAGDLQKVRQLNLFFFQTLGFGGNVNHYFDPDNSFLPVVLRTRRGIPITLAVLWLELAQGIGLKAAGVNFPGHFMVKVSLPQGQAVIDPFTGQSLSREDLSERLEPYKRRQGLVDDFDVPVGLYLQAATPRDIVARVLRNLKEIYRAQEDWPRMLAVMERLVILLPQDWAERRDRGLTYAELGHNEQAVADLQAYLTHADEALDSDLLMQRLTHLRSGHGG